MIDDPMVIALLSLALAVAPPCATEAPTTAGLHAAESDWVAAIEARDGLRLACRLGLGFGDTDWQGALRSRDDVLMALPSRPASTLALSDLSVRIEGKIGIVRGINTQTGPDGKTVGSVRFTDVFLYADHRWQAISAQETVVHR
jgi:hypothetical protein